MWLLLLGNELSLLVSERVRFEDQRIKSKQNNCYNVIWSKNVTKNNPIIKLEKICLRVNQCEVNTISLLERMQKYTKNMLKTVNITANSFLAMASVFPFSLHC